MIIENIIENKKIREKQVKDEKGKNQKLKK